MKYYKNRPAGVNDGFEVLPTDHDVRHVFLVRGGSSKRSYGQTSSATKLAQHLLLERWAWDLFREAHYELSLWQVDWFAWASTRRSHMLDIDRGGVRGENEYGEESLGSHDCKDEANTRLI